MKKFFFCLFLLSLFLPLAAQEEVNEQYELFSWEPVAKARQYGVTIEKYDAVLEHYVDYKEIKTKDTQVEVLFTPGVYRVSIASYNLLGRKGKASEWVEFKILEENIPYLNDKLFAKSKVWNVPVLFISKSGSTEQTTQNNPDSENYIKSPENYASNTILVKGRNIFSPKTEFYLIPKDQGEGQPFETWNSQRREQKLKILYRNSKEYSVVVSYDAQALSAGYYSLEVRNTGNNRDAVDILVLDDCAPQINPSKGFEIDEHYSVNSINISASEYQLAVLGSGISSATSFYLEPSKGPYEYPFESQASRSRVDVQIVEAENQDGSNTQVSLSFPTEELRTGYYNLVAKNWDGATARILCLVKKSFNNDYTKKVDKLKTKYNKKTDYVDITLQDDVFTQGKIYTLVSEYDESLDSNKKIPLVLDQNGKKLVGRLSPDEFTIAKYALMIEDAQGSDVIYCDIDNTLKLSMSKMNEREIEKTFFRPAGKETQVTLDVSDTGIIQFIDNRVKMTKRLPSFFNYMRVDLSMPKESNFVFNLEFDIFNNGFIGFTTGAEYRMQKDNLDNIVAIYSVAKISIPNDYFSPYLGIGIGQTGTSRKDEVNGFSDMYKLFSSKDTIYGIAQLGVSLFVVLDVRYNLFLNNMFSGNKYFTDSVSFGFSFPLRSYKFKRKVLSRTAQITKPGDLDISSFIEPKSNVDDVEVIYSTTVTGLEDFHNIHTITIDDTVEVLEENSFRNCKNLEKVTFKNAFNTGSAPLTIKNGAFANDTQLDTIYLPYRTTVVQTGAFAGWTNGQNIILNWEPDDTKERDLTGLLNCTATVHYRDGSLFKGSFKNPMEDQSNWVPLNKLNVENVSVNYEGSYILGIRLRGVGERWYKTELDSWINQDTPQEALDFIKNGSKLSFKVQGDGNKYYFILTTPEGGYFYYKFKTQKDKVTTIEIPFKKMKKYSYSSQKKLDIDNIKMFCIMPECKGEWNEISFFDFEVIQ